MRLGRGCLGPARVRCPPSLRMARFPTQSNAFDRALISSLCDPSPFLCGVLQSQVGPNMTEKEFWERYFRFEMAKKVSSLASPGAQLMCGCGRALIQWTSLHSAPTSTLAKPLMNAHSMASPCVEQVLVKQPPTTTPRRKSATSGWPSWSGGSRAAPAAAAAAAAGRSPWMLTWTRRLRRKLPCLRKTTRQGPGAALRLRGRLSSERIRGRHGTGTGTVPCRPHCSPALLCLPSPLLPPPTPPSALAARRPPPLCAPSPAPRAPRPGRRCPAPRRARPTPRSTWGRTRGTALGRATGCPTTPRATRRWVPRGARGLFPGAGARAPGGPGGSGGAGPVGVVDRLAPPRAGGARGAPALASPPPRAGRARLTRVVGSAPARASARAPSTGPFEFGSKTGSNADLSGRLQVPVPRYCGGVQRPLQPRAEGAVARLGARRRRRRGAVSGAVLGRAAAAAGKGAAGGG